MNRHCIAVSCLALVSLSMTMPFVQCYEHIDCHVHHDEQTRTITLSGTASNASVSILGSVTGPSASIEE